MPPPRTPRAPPCGSMRATTPPRGRSRRAGPPARRCAWRSLQRDRHELRQRFGASRMCRELRIPALVDRGFLAVVLREAAHARGDDIGSRDARALHPAGRGSELLELRERRIRLARDALDPCRMALVRGTLLLLVD